MCINPTICDLYECQVCRETSTAATRSSSYQLRLHGLATDCLQGRRKRRRRDFLNFAMLARDCNFGSNCVQRQLDLSSSPRKSVWRRRQMCFPTFAPYVRIIFVFVGLYSISSLLHISLFPNQFTTGTSIDLNFASCSRVQAAPKKDLNNNRSDFAASSSIRLQVTSCQLPSSTLSYLQLFDSSCSGCFETEVVMFSEEPELETLSS